MTVRNERKNNACKFTKNAFEDYVSPMAEVLSLLFTRAVGQETFTQCLKDSSVFLSIRPDNQRFVSTENFL